MIKLCCKCNEMEDHYEGAQNISVCKKCRRAARVAGYTSVRKVPLLTPEEKLEHHSAYIRSYRKRNRELLKKKARDRYANRTPNQKKLKQKRDKRRNEKLYGEGYENILELRKELKSLKRCNFVDCAICKGMFRPADIEVDHIVPLCKGGTNAESNLQLVCKQCNCEKGVKQP